MRPHKIAATARMDQRARRTVSVSCLHSVRADAYTVRTKGWQGAKDRLVTLPDELIVPLRRHLANRKTVFDRDCVQGSLWLGHESANTTHRYMEANLAMRMSNRLTARIKYRSRSVTSS